jgi:hypothetical protein
MVTVAHMAESVSIGSKRVGFIWSTLGSVSASPGGVSRWSRTIPVPKSLAGGVAPEPVNSFSAGTQAIRPNMPSANQSGALDGIAHGRSFIAPAIAGRPGRFKHRI